MERGKAYAFLRQQGIDPLRSALAILYRDDVGLLLAVVVASAETMMEVEIEYPADLDESQAMEAGRIGDWSADAERIAAENRDFVEAALRLLSETLA